ncbi:hypothetical protein GCM10020331_012350 [Ectobacillus funiculus]
MAMTDRAKGLDTFAHEAGHILFNQYNPVTGSWNDDDPSGPYVDQRGIIDRFHNNDPNNLMAPVGHFSTNLSSITITAAQCAKSSKTVE